MDQEEGLITTISAYHQVSTQIILKRLKITGCINCSTTRNTHGFIYPIELPYKHLFSLYVIFICLEWHWLFKFNHRYKILKSYEYFHIKILRN